MMDERSLVLLRRKLEALNYTEALDATSAPLVSHIINDLIRTTDSYRVIKQQASKYAQEIATFNTKLEVVKHDSGRLSKENTQLHEQLIREAERYEQLQKESYQRTKKLEDQVAELSYWRQQAVSRYDGLEKDNQGLRKKVAELIKLGEKRSKAGFEPVDDVFKINMSKGISALAAAPPPVPASLINLQAASDARIASLQQQLSSRAGQVADLQQQLAAAHQAVSARDAEVTRLGELLGGGPDVDKLAKDQMAAASENIILSLNKQVDHLSAQLTQAQHEIEDKQRLESSLAAADRGRREAEEKLAAALRHNAATARDLVTLKEELKKLESRQATAGAAAAGELNLAMASVTELKNQLSTAKAQQDKLKAELDTAKSVAEAAKKREQHLQQEMEELRFLMDEAHAKADAASHRESTAAADAAAAVTMAAAGDVSVQQLQQENKQLQQQLDSQAEALEALSKARDEARLQLSDTQQLLDQQRQAAKDADNIVVTLERRLADLQAEVSRLESSQASALAAAEAARHQLLEAQQQHRELAAAAQEAGGDSAVLAAQVSQMMQQLQREQEERQHLSSEVDQLQADNAALKSRLGSLQSELEAAQAAASKAESQLTHNRTLLVQRSAEVGSAQGLSAQLEEAQAQLGTYKARLSAAEDEVKQLCRSVATNSSSQAATSTVIADLQRLIDEITGERDRLEAQLSDARAAAASATAARDRAQAEAQRAESAQVLAQEQLEQLRASIDDGHSSAAAADARIAGMQSRVSTLQKALSHAEAEVERLSGLLATAEAAAAAAKGREDSARAHGREYAERARRAETLVEETEAELAEVRRQLEAAQRSTSEARDEVARLAGELAGKTAQVEQLTSLSLRGDATLQDYMASLKSLSADLRARKLEVDDLKSQIEAKDDALAAAGAETSQMHKALREIDHTRDELLAQLELSKEDNSQLQEELVAARASADEIARHLAAAEGRLLHSEDRISELTGELKSLQEQLSGSLGQLSACQAENIALKEELQALGEDMQALVRENQVVSNELASLDVSHRGLQEANEQLKQQLHNAEQLLRVREVEVEDVRGAYEGLATEHRRLQSTIMQLERDAALREASLASASDEIAALKDEARATAATLQQQMLELSAYERQVDHLGRQLMRGAADSEEVANQREGLLAELAAAQQVRLMLERNREDLQRQLAAADTQLSVMQARLGDANTEVEGLRQRLGLEQGRVSELEGLLAAQRAREYRSELDVAKSGGQLGAMQQKNKVLEEQVTSLQQQVVALTQSNTVQDRELARLRAETLSLAAKTAAAAGATPSRLSGSSSGSGGDVAERRSSSSGVPAGQQDGLQQQLAAAEEHNQMLLLKVGKLQEENNTLQRQLGDCHQQLQRLESDKGRLLELLTAADAAAHAAAVAAGSTPRRSATSGTNYSSATGSSIGAGNIPSSVSRGDEAGQQLISQQQQRRSSAAGSSTVGSGVAISGVGQRSARRLSLSGASVSSSSSSGSVAEELRRAQQMLQEEQARRARAESNLAQLMAVVEQDSP